MRIKSLTYPLFALLVFSCVSTLAKDLSWTKDQILGHTFNLQSKAEEEILICNIDGTVSILPGWRNHEVPNQFQNVGKFLNWKISKDGHLVVFENTGKVIKDMVLLDIEGYYYTVLDQSKRKIYRQYTVGGRCMEEVKNRKEITIYIKEGLDYALNQCDGIELRFNSPGGVTSSIRLHERSQRFKEIIEFVRNTKQGHMNYKSKGDPNIQFEVNIHIFKYELIKGSGITEFKYNHNLSTRDFSPEFIKIVNALGGLTLMEDSEAQQGGAGQPATRPESK
jgi:hypothetical protein